MTRTDEFAKDMKSELERKTGPHWKCGGRVGSGREAVDVCGELNGAKVFIEVELRRDEPVTNVLKFWRAAKGRRRPKNAILIHAFSSHYDPKNKRPNTHRANAEFIGKQLQRVTGIRYASFSFKYRPTKGGKVGGDYRCRAAKKVARRVLKLLNWRSRS